MVEQWQTLLRCDLGVWANATASRSSPDTIYVAHDSRLPLEGYGLQIDPFRIRLAVAAPVGAFYAFQTLKQLLPLRAFAAHRDAGRAGAQRQERWWVPAVDIRDWPRYHWRGLMLDSARHFYGVDHIKHLLDLMAMHKLNIFHWHLTDDQVLLRGQDRFLTSGGGGGGSRRYLVPRAGTKIERDRTEHI